MSLSSRSIRGLGHHMEMRTHAPAFQPRTESDVAGARFLCLSHPDFHTPDSVVMGEGFDAEEYVLRMKDAGADAVAMFGSCHYGYCYFPSKIGTVHPNLRQDLSGEVSKACRKHGLGIVAYHSVFPVDEVARRFPDWRFKSVDWKVDSNAGYDHGRYSKLRVNSPYLEEYFLPILKETLRHCELDELFLDTMQGAEPCRCRHCERKFGAPIPESYEADPEGWKR